MKKIILMFATLGLVNIGFGQKLKDAKSSIKAAQDLLILKNNGDAVKKLNEAKSVVDALSTQGKTAEDPEVWYYKAAVYSLMQEVPEFSNTAPYKVAGEAFDKAMSLNKKKTLGFDNAPNLILNLGFFNYNAGVNSLNTNKFKDAAKEFEVTYNYLNTNEGSLFKEMKQVDTIKAKALMMGGVASYYAEDYELAVKTLELASKNPINAKEDNIYLNLANSYGKLNQKEKQLEIIEKGKKLFPGNENMAAAEINFYIDKGEIDKVVTKIQDELKNNPNRDDLHYNLGLTHLEMVKRNAGKPEEMNYWKSASESFNKAASLKPENIDYRYSEAIAIFNIAATINNEMTQTNDNAKLEKLGNERDANFRKAIPLLLSVKNDLKNKGFSTLSNSDKAKVEQSLRSLSTIYANLEMNEEYNKVQSELKDL